ncbi:MAG: signal recognition particle protein [Deltaproteobacteria bacterium]|nr:MAG: signal recognition particle protein [Deltaproteobacteria bacterium]
MFDTISKGFRSARERFTGRAELTEDVVDAALKDVRLALLEADVEFRVAKKFLRAVREKALGEEVRLVAEKDGKKIRVRPEDHFVRICHEELVALMGPVDTDLARASKGATGIMMVGLQGSGKTTTSGKLARKLQKEGHKVLLVAADVYRPAAVHQLEVLGERIGVPVFAKEGEDPVEICAEATDLANREGFDFVIYDTAGRLSVDEALMAELERIAERVHPANTLLVIDAMIGQDAVSTAKAFDERLDVSGVVLTKLDGDARGGAALSIKAATGKPIKFLGMGESLDRLEAFRPEGLASRILGMGDIVGLVQDLQEVVDEEQAAKDAEKMLGGSFTMDDFLQQIRTIQKMGSMKDLMDKLPLSGMLGGDVPQEALEEAMDDRELVKIEAMIQSMTRKERARPDLFLTSHDRGKARRSLQRGRKKKARPSDPAKFADLGPADFVTSRIERVARGSGTTPEDVRGLVARFLAMREMFKLLGGMMGGGLMSKLPGIKQMRQMSAMRKLAQDPNALAALGGGMPGMPGMPALAGAGAGGMGTSRSRPKDRNAQRKKRRNEKKARRKNRRK